MTHDGRCSLQRRVKVVGLAIGLGCLAGQSMLPALPESAGRNTLLSEAGKALFPCFAGQAQAWDDAPLCMARQPDRAEEEEALLGLDGELSCLPGEIREAAAGPLWTAPITAAEARSALTEADTLAQQGELANAMLKLRVVE